VPPYKHEFLSKPATSRGSCAGRSATDSLRRGVDSPESIASLTIQPPEMSIASHGRPESSFVRVIEMRSPGKSSSEGISIHLLQR
jgi:hypothetical protein